MLYKTLEEMFIKDGRCNFISITGGGGKTTLLSLFGQYLKNTGRSVLLTTTTKVQAPLYHDYLADHVFQSEASILSYEVEKGSMVFYAEKNSLDVKKAFAPRPEILDVLADRFDCILCEADGSRGLPMKIHSSRDPVIHPKTTSVIAVMGAGALFGKICYVVFGDEGETFVDEKYLKGYFDNPEAVLKGMDGYEGAVLVNAAEDMDDKGYALFSSISIPYPIIFCSEKKDEIYARI